VTAGFLIAALANFKISQVLHPLSNKQRFGLAHCMGESDKKQPMSLERMPPLPITSSGCQPTPIPVHGGTPRLT
jgi:hypothetical protein